VPNVIIRAEGTIKTYKNKSPEAVMDSARSDRARARARYLLAQLAPLPDDSEVQRLRELSMDYIREAERLEKEQVTTRELSEQISAVLDGIAREFFARALFKEKSKGSPSNHSLER
jgi:hypothetical protein